METLKEIKKLRSNANSIYTLFNQKIPHWDKDKKHYDKTGWGFNLDNRFNACKPVLVAFSSHMGTYGDSGCSSQCSLDDNVFAKHLIKVLNSYKEQIMLAVAGSIEKEALTLKEQAEAEINANLAMLKQLEESVNAKVSK